MQATSKIIRKRLKERFPKLKRQRIILHDPIYDLCEFTVIESLTKRWGKHKLPKLQFVPFRSDCDKFSLLYHAWIAELRMMDDNGDYAWALGEADMWRFDGIEGMHAVNIFLTDTEIYVLDPQAPVIRAADPALDVLFLVDF